MLRPPEETGRGRLLNGLKKRLLNSRAESPNQHSLQVLSNAMSSNATDCLIAPHFPGEIALITIQTANGLAARSTAKRQLDNSTDSDLARRSRSSQSVRTTAHPKPTGAQTLVVLTQALVAVGPEVTVTPLSRKGGSVPPLVSAHKRGGSNIGALSLCEGRGPIAVAGCGRIRRMRLNPKQKRVVECTRAVGWTTGVTCLPAGERASSIDSGALPASVIFIGPGAVYIQTHSLAVMKRLLAPIPHITGRGGMSGFPRMAHVSGTGRGVVAGLSLKRGLAKRVQAGAKKIVLAVGLFSLYIMAYSVVTTLLLEGREGLVRVPRHALQVVRSLLSIARRIMIILIRLGREELWVKEAVGQEGTAGNVPKPRENGLAGR